MTDHVLRLTDRNAGAVAQQINRLYEQAPVVIDGRFRVTSIATTQPAVVYGTRLSGERVGVVVRAPGQVMRELTFKPGDTITLTELPVSAPVPIPSPRSSR